MTGFRRARSNGVQDLLHVVTKARAFIVSVFLLSASGIFVTDLPKVPPPAFVVEMRSDTNAVAQLFFDVGRGINESDSVRLPINATTSYRYLRFSLPAAKIKALRFDPINTSGTFSLRGAAIENSFGVLRRPFALNELKALQQIASRAETASELTFSTVPGAADPILQIAIRAPVNLAPSRWQRAQRVAIQFAMCLLVTVLVGGIYLGTMPYCAPIGSALDRVAAFLSEPAFLVFDRFAVGCYAGILLFFVVTVAGALHGSSITLYSTATAVALAPDHPIAGTGKPIRGDEWAYHTPAILHQIYRADPFAAERTPLGPDYTALFSNLPVRHLTTVFRPQFWGFFILPPDYAFSFYWQCKALLLLTGVFSLLLLLTQSSKLAAFGALWYAFSPNIQWTYSWPSLLPEMIGLFCLVICAVFYLSVGRRPAFLVSAAVVCAAGAVDFALCAYIPHQIPLVWFGVFLCIFWLMARWKSIFRRDYAILRIAALTAAWGVVGLVMWAFYLDAAPGLTTMANTLYPGRRSMPSGGYSFQILSAHFFSFWESDVRLPLPQIFVNICESTGYFWLAPLTLFAIRGVDGEAEKKRGYWVLMAFGTLLVVWMTCTIPQGFNRALFLDKTGAGRAIHVLGFVNVSLVTLFLSLSPIRPATGSGVRQTLLLGAAVFTIAYPVLALLNEGLARFLTASELAVAASYLTAVTVALVESRVAWLAAFLVLPHVAVFGLVNPVDRGLRVLETAPVFQFVQSRPELLRDRWIVYSAGLWDSTFFSAAGCDVVNGLKYVPDLKAFAVLDPTGSQRDLVNRSAWLLAEPEYGNRAPTIEEIPPNLLRLRVNPLDPALRKIGVRYAAFSVEPPKEIAGRMRLLAGERVSGFWLYELP